jgi:dolichol-phosphate mannosyltransferase
LRRRATVLKKSNPVTREDDPYIETLAVRERYRDAYFAHRDPIASDRMLWRAQTFRHLVHLIPGQSILVLGAGKGLITEQVAAVTRGENPITAVSFKSSETQGGTTPATLEFISAQSLPGPLATREFDFIIAVDLLDQRNCAWLIQKMYDLLKPGGEVVVYESNPWNIVRKIRHAIAGVFGRPDPRILLSRSRLYELMSEVGFVRVFSIYNDFVYAPLNRQLVWLLRNVSIVLENTPVLQTLAGSILAHAQKPPVRKKYPRRSLFRHESLRGAVSIVIPCHNEEMNISPLVTQMVALYGDYLHEIVLVDDNSEDDTRGVIERLREDHPFIKPVYRTPPNGVGRALADGYRVASGRFILSMDCDFQHLLPEFRDLFDAAAEGRGFIVGSRFSRHSVLLNYPFSKIVANRGFHLIAQLVFLRRFRDLTNNLKLMRREIVEKLLVVEPGFAANAETGLQPLLMGCALTEVPISWINRTSEMGASSFRLVRVGGGYWRVLWHLWLGKVFRVGRYKSLFSRQGSEVAQ